MSVTGEEGEDEGKEEGSDDGGALERALRAPRKASDEKLLGKREDAKEERGMRSSKQQDHPRVLMGTDERL
jgi:hypothetical protein